MTETGRAEGGSCGVASEELEVVRDGLRLRGTLALPDGANAAHPAPLALLMHGIRGSRNAYRLVRFAHALARRGVASARFDLNGRGDSDGAFEDMTVPGELADLEAVLSALSARPELDCGRLALLGHSQGGVDAILLAARHAASVSALVLLAPATVLEEACRERSNPFPVGRGYVETGARLRIYENAPAYRGPVCIVHGARDALVPLSCSERLAQVYGQADLHVFSDDDHALMRCHDEMEALVVSFIARHLFPEATTERERGAFLGMLRWMRSAGQLGRLDDPKAPIPPRVREGIEEWGVTEDEL